jgi:proteasome alpha subunit
MLTPYDWQEGIGHRMSFIEGRLIAGSSILAMSIPDGVIVFSYRRHTQKIFEIYDQLVFSAIGQQSDVEALRIAALDFAHQEGFSRSERDVTIRRVVSALSAPIKRAFADFSSAPFVIRALFSEVCRTPEEDTFAILDYEETSRPAVNGHS